MGEDLLSALNHCGIVMAAGTERTAAAAGTVGIAGMPIPCISPWVVGEIVGREGPRGSWGRDAGVECRPN